MAIPLGEAVHTKFFTPPEYQVELLNAAIEGNIIACVNNIPTKTFLVLKLIEESFGILHRKTVKKKLALLIAETSQSVLHYTSVLKHLTNYHVDDLSQSSSPIKTDGEQSQVVVATSSQALDIISSSYVHLNEVNLLIVDDCHFAINKTHPLKRIMEYVHNYSNIKIFGMTYPVYVNSDLNPGKVEADLNELQKVMRCTVDTTSEIASLLKYNIHPTEHLIECEAYKKTKLDEIILKEVSNTIGWIKDHRHDPSEIYDEEFSEDLKKMPDPNVEPLKIIDDFVNVLETMGLWCANKAALASLFTIEKLKVKTPYERHFLALCTISTLMLKIRAILDDFFSEYDEKQLAYKFISPKVRRLVDILLQYKPSERLVEDGNNVNVHVNNTMKNITIDNCLATNKCLSRAGDKRDANYSPGSEKIGCLTLNDTYLQYKHEKLNRWRARKRGYAKQFLPPKPKPIINQMESVRGVIFVKNRLFAMVTHYLLADLKKYDDDNFWWLCPQFTAEKTADPIKEAREAEVQHQKLEDALRKFRTRECNILIGTSMLEEGFDLPRCNLTVRFDTPLSFRSYVHSKTKASVVNSHSFILFESSEKHQFLSKLAQYYQIQRLLLNRCKTQIDNEEEQNKADKYDDCVEPFVVTNENGESTVIKPSNSIACVNRYCAKLPSDAFTRLTPIWKVETVHCDMRTMYVSSLRLPINSPFRKEIIGVPVPSKTLSKRLAALAMCTFLYNVGELDGNMQPICKENFHLFFASDEIPPDNVDNINELEPNEPRPGTNKRKQYYRKKVASCLSNCHPVPKKRLFFYNIEMTLSCEIPEDQNIRGRKIRPPEESPMSFGMLLSNPIPKICPFPIYTRCGEVIVSLQLCEANLELSDYRLKLLENFLHYTFTKVLRLQKYYMKFDSVFGRSLYFIVPTLKTSDSDIAVIDWEFVYEINRRKDDVLTFIPDNVREHFIFKRELYTDAVVMPWYRNQDVPQFFYVAEICSNLTPKSKFPGEEYKSFEEYYWRKYHLKVHDVNQPLLDVDHTSARLNFLTPRYVNRKGVALPTCSEATKKARRENLEQKQILVPELCTIHPFPASLWSKAVCLPCIMYRINSLLLAEEIRYKVSMETDLGIRCMPEDFNWDALNFGWTLADVIRKTAELKESKAAKELSGKLPLKITEIANDEENKTIVIDEEDDSTKNRINNNNNVKVDNANDNSDNNVRINGISDEDGKETETSSATNIKTADGSENNADEEPLLEIGTWSNEMASGIHDYSPEFESNFARTLTMVRYGSPTRWMEQNEDFDLDSFGDCSDDSNDSYENPSGIRIEFKSDFLAEAHDEIDDKISQMDDKVNLAICWDWEHKPDINDDVRVQMKYFEKAVNEHLDKILSQNRIVTGDDVIAIKPFENETRSIECPNVEKLTLDRYLTSDNHYDVTIFDGVTNDGVNNSNNNLHAIMVNGYDGINSHIHFDDYDYDYDELNDKANKPTTNDNLFSFDYQPDLKRHLGPSPSILLQALTMSNANDGLNLERLETIGDSFLKYAITSYLYCTYDNVHEGKLSHLRSKQVSNLNLYRLGKMKVLGKYIVAGKFEPHDNWLPPCFQVPVELEKSLIESKVVSCFLAREDLPYVWHVKANDITLVLKSKLTESTCENQTANVKDAADYLPFHLVTYQTIADKSIADCVESLIGAYLIACGVRGATLFVSWLGIKVLPFKDTEKSYLSEKVEYDYLKPPSSPLLKNVPDSNRELDSLLQGYDEFERIIGYRFRDRSYLLQAMTHASYATNRITDCYQRLEFLGDAILDYLITRHLYEDKRRHSPGALTDLRSALVNNTIFASLAIRFNFHKFFLHLSPGLADVIYRFVRIQEDNGHTIFEEYYLIGEEECEEAEDVEVPKALGDIFESIAGAIYLDSDMSLDAVWKVYYRIMQNEIEQFSMNVPKSPIRELLELEPETAKFGRPEKLADGRRVRVTVDVFGKGTFKGIGRNYRIAKCTAAKCALKQLKKKGLLSKKVTSTANVRGHH